MFRKKAKIIFALFLVIGLAITSPFIFSTKASQEVAKEFTCEDENGGNNVRSIDDQYSCNAILENQYNFCYYLQITTDLLENSRTQDIYLLNVTGSFGYNTSNDLLTINDTYFKIKVSGSTYNTYSLTNFNVGDYLIINREGSTVYCFKFSYQNNRWNSTQLQVINNIQGRYIYINTKAFFSYYQTYEIDTSILTIPQVIENIEYVYIYDELEIQDNVYNAYVFKEHNDFWSNSSITQIEICNYLDIDENHHYVYLYKGSNDEPYVLDTYTAEGATYNVLYEYNKFSYFTMVIETRTQNRSYTANQAQCNVNRLINLDLDNYYVTSSDSQTFNGIHELKFNNENITICYSVYPSNDEMYLDIINGKIPLINMLDNFDRTNLLESYNDGYAQGYLEGSTGETAISPFWETITSLFSGLGQILAIELFPNFPLGIFVAIPLFFGVVGFILWIWRKH